MRPVSAAFLSAVRGSHVMAVRARAVVPGQTGVDPDGVEIAVLGGDVSLDAGADIRSTIDLTTDGYRMWPSTTSVLLAPYGNEVFVERGIQFGNGVTEWCSLGYHRINEPEQDEVPDGPIRLSGSDRMAGLIDARLLEPIQFGASATLGDVVDELVTDVYPGAVIEWDDDTDDVTLGRTLIAEEGRHRFLDDLVTAQGKIWHWDHRGVLVIAAPPDPATPVYTVDSGRHGVLVSMARRLTRDGVYNAVVAVGEAADDVTPVRAAAVDNNPTSPTYFYGGFGKVPTFFTSPFMTTTAQAAVAADSLLRKKLGLPYSVDFTTVPNPALEPYDPIWIRYPGRLERHIVQSLTIPLTAEEPLTATTREQTVVIVGTS
jgi:hypothetical protein